MRVKIIFIMLAVIASFGSCNLKEDESTNLKLWYTKPATIWEEALPVGNGRIGAMIYGGVENEIIQLNEETVWAGEPGNNIVPDIKEHLEEIRTLIFQDKRKEAQNLIDQFTPAGQGETTNSGMPYQTIGALNLKIKGNVTYENYHRQLDIANAVSKVQYSIDGVNYQRNTIASLTDDIIVMEILANKANSINFTLGLSSAHKKKKIEIEDNAIWLKGTSSNFENKKGKVKFATVVKPKVEGGKVVQEGNTLTIENADKVVIYISIGTNFRNYEDLSGDAKEKAKLLLNKAYAKNLDNIFNNHTRKYKSYFDRVHLDLGVTDSIYNPTDIRLQQFAKGNDPQLIALFFQYGRYLLISSSQPGGQAANLQGLWSHKLVPAWDSKYTININTEMNYWPAEVTNLSEMHEPLFDLIKNVSVTGKESASKMYGARGWNVHHNTDIWRITGVVDAAFWGLWPSGGAWLSQHLWQHYLYTGDKEFLKEIYPILQGAALFYKDVLVPEPENEWLVLCPSNSPENGYEGSSMVAGATMDNQLIFDVFSNMIKAASILNKDEIFADSLKTIIPQLAPMQVGNWGQLQEWMHDKDRKDDHHRHVSHLYGLFPSNQISPYRTPELFSAAKTSLMARGDKSTGWSMGWKVNLWARFLDGDHALKLITDQLTPSIQPNGNQKGGTYPNLFDAHPPFQIDGNFGCTAGISEMLIQSHDEAIHLLPALPGSWKNGSITGLKTRGGFIVDISWENGEIKNAVLKSTLGGNCRIRSYVPLKGENLKNATGSNSNPFFFAEKTKEPLINSKESIKKPELKKVYEYDVATNIGDLIQVNIY